MLNSTQAVFPHELVERRGHETSSSQRRRILEWLAFRRVLDHERARSDRSGLPFVVVVFETRDRAVAASDLRTTAELLNRRLRSIDEIGWMSDGRLAALLPYTSSDEAWKFIDELTASYPISGLPPACEVLAYPSSWPAAETPDDDIDDDELPRRPRSQLEPVFVQPLPAWKRIVDVVGAVFGLCVLAPLMLLVALTIKLTSIGPVLFIQWRTGLGGRRFRMLKFRTMIFDAEKKRSEYLTQNEQDGPAFKVTNDPRVTPIGRLLRITSIDELPQLWNVLQGEMSLVGPRPLPCAEAEACEVWQRRRHDVTPGITCLWQVRGRTRHSFSQWMRLDLEYIRTRCLWTDVKLLLQTIPTVLNNRTDR